MDSQDTPPDDPQKELESPPSPAGQPGAEMLHKQVRELQAKLEDHQKRATHDHAVLWEENIFLKKLFTGALIALVILNLGLMPFLYKQMRMVRLQLPNQRVTTFKLNQYMVQNDPLLKQAAADLQAYAAAHPDFRPILQRYQESLSLYFTHMTAPLPSPDL